MTLNKKYTSRKRFIRNYSIYRRAGLLVDHSFDGHYYILTVLTH